MADIPAAVTAAASTDATDIDKKICEVKGMKYVCDVCGWVYDEDEGYPEGGIAPGTKWEDLPEDFECPLCAVGKDQFSKE